MRLDWKQTVRAVGVASALVLAFAVVGFAQGPPPPGGFHGGPGPHDGLGPLLHDLALTADQEAQIKKIVASAEESTKSLRDQLRALHESAPDPLKDGIFDETSVRAAAEARSKVEVELEVAHARVMSQIFALLAPDQKAQLAAKRLQFEQRREQMSSQPR